MPNAGLAPFTYRIYGIPGISIMIKIIITDTPNQNAINLAIPAKKRNIIMVMNPVTISKVIGSFILKI